MTVQIEDLRARIGLVAGDTSRDAELLTARAVSIAFMENYCDRKFEFDQQRETTTHFVGQAMHLKRYPIDHVYFVRDADQAVINDCHIDQERGIIFFDRGIARHKIDVFYEGGYKEFPNDLLAAFWMIFDQQIATGGGVGLAAGEIQSVTLADVGTVRYATGAAAAEAGGAGFLPDSAAALLEAYCRRFA